VNVIGGTYVPEPGYTWANPQDAVRDLEVRWCPGQQHSAVHPHLVAEATEGTFAPAPGYWWVGAAPGDLRVRWVRGRHHSVAPHVRAHRIEGRFVPEDWYVWVYRQGEGDLSVKLLRGFHRLNRLVGLGGAIATLTVTVLSMVLGDLGVLPDEIGMSLRWWTVCSWLGLCLLMEVLQNVGLYSRRRPKSSVT
jgi:hypothetical protein